MNSWKTLRTSNSIFTVPAWIFSAFLFATAKVASITAMIFFRIILHHAILIYDFHIFITTGVITVSFSGHTKKTWKMNILWQSGGHVSWCFVNHCRIGNRAVFSWLSKVIEELVWFWFYYGLWLASVFTLLLILRQSSENRSMVWPGCWVQYLFIPIFCNTSFDNCTHPQHVSGKQTTYPFPNSTLTLTSYLGQNISLGEG